MSDQRMKQLGLGAVAALCLAPSMAAAERQTPSGYAVPRYMDKPDIERFVAQMLPA